jgi:hypothetical protein
MKKILVAILTMLTIFAPMQIAKAADERVVAIIDTAIDSNKNPSVIYEVCFSPTKSIGYCPNNAPFMEGRGSANTAFWPLSANLSNNIYHGQKMVSASVKTDANIKIVFLRVYSINQTTGSLATEYTNIINALDWVSANASKYSIDAVSISQSMSSTTAISNCSNAQITKAVESLKNQNIPVFAATGNDGFRDKVGFPACVNNAIGIGALNVDGTMLQPVTNTGTGFDAVTIGDMNITNSSGTKIQITGTSVANVVAATKYVGQISLFDQFISVMKNGTWTIINTSYTYTKPFIK